MSFGSVVTLEELKILLRAASTELNATGRDSQPYHPDDFTVARSVRLVEKNGLPLIVKYGTRVKPVEADTTLFVSRNTSVRVPDIYAIFTEVEEHEPEDVEGIHAADIEGIGSVADEPRSMTYIVEERLPGRTLKEAWPVMTHSERLAIAVDLKNIFTQLSDLAPRRICLGPLCGPWQNEFFRPFEDCSPCGDNDARTLRDFLSYFHGIATSAGSRAHKWRLEHIDLGRHAVFSHGDLQPCNILVSSDRGARVVGIIDWAAAGWWPYFWNTFVLLSSKARFRSLDGWEKIMPILCEWLPEEAREFETVLSAAMAALGEVEDDIQYTEY